MRPAPLYRGDAHSVAEQVLRDVFTGLRDKLIQDMAAHSGGEIMDLLAFQARAKHLEAGMEEVRHIISALRKDLPKP